jgi:energy-coupling factor transporter ATP-binding protein EcfA2
MGIRAKIFEFGEFTNVYGKNAAGKTTILHAFNFLLFGKNAFDQKDFSIKTLDENNNPIHRAEHFVEGVIDQDGVYITLKRVYREKWIRKRGYEVETFEGHETAYFVNSVPVSLGDYQKAVDGIVKESVFKLLTNPLHFNSLKWDIRREMLFKLVPAVTNSEIAGDDPAFIELIRVPDLERHKKELSAKRLLLKKNLDDIPSRIDEVKRGTPQPVDVAAINTEIEKIDIEIVLIDSKINAANNAYDSTNAGFLQKQKAINTMKAQLSDLQFNESERVKKVNNETVSQSCELNRKINAIKSRIAIMSAELTNYEGQLSTKQKDREILLKKWHEKNAEQMPEVGEFICAACNRPFEGNDLQVKVDEAKANWNKTKANELANITASGKLLAANIEALTNKVAEIKAVIEAEKAKLPEMEAKYAQPVVTEVEIVTDEMLQLENQIKKAEEELKAQPAKPDISELNRQKSELNLKRDQLKVKLNIADTITKAEARIKELETDQRSLSQQIADLEKKEFAVDRFVKRKIDIIEGRINEKFNNVRFKMYNQLINGGEEPTCITLIDGVPWEDANNAAKIWAGIEIIKAFSDWSDIYCPIWIDNRESVTEIPATKCQVINLVVSPADEVLRVESLT